MTAYRAPKPTWGSSEPLSYRSQRAFHPDDVDLDHVSHQGFAKRVPALTPPQPEPEPSARPATQPSPEPSALTIRIPRWLITAVIPFVCFACVRGFKSAALFEANEKACIERGYKAWAQGGDSSKPGRLKYKSGFCY